jgi:thiamine transport system ATP-binding protein
MLEIIDLHFQYPETTVNYRFNLRLKRGELLALSGPSGAGKSTLLDLVAGFLTGGSGVITIDGIDVTALAVDHRPVTILFQRHNLFEHLTVETNVALGLSANLRLTADDWARVHQALADVGIAALATASAARLSGGEQQRAALARSLVRAKPVLLLDEPFAALDPETRGEMLALVRRIVDERNLMVLMVTHDQNDAERIADRHMVLRNGELTESTLEQTAK